MVFTLEITNVKDEIERKLKSAYFSGSVC